MQNLYGKPVVHPFDALMYHSWIQSFQTLVNHCSYISVSVIIYLLESWEFLLPSWIVELLNEFILLKINNEIAKCNDLRNFFSHLEIWIHPWMRRFGPELGRTVYLKVLEKFANVLLYWTPLDNSALQMLLPWFQVFPHDTEKFILKNILPKLQRSFSNWKINPRCSNLDIWYSVMNWKDLIPHHFVIELLVTYFFPNWLMSLSLWLKENPNYDHIIAWYTNWKALFPAEVLENPIIECQLSGALVLMSNSLNSCCQ